MNGFDFGWMAMEVSFAQEVERSPTNRLRTVKDLRENFIH